MFPWNKKFPFNQSDGQMPDAFKNMNPKNVEDYIQTIMGNVFGEGFQTQFPYQGNVAPAKTQQTVSRKPELFETNDHIFVKISASEEQASTLRIQHNSNQLFIMNYPENGKQEKIILPSLVRRKGTKASYKNGVLEIRLQKNEDLQMSEIDVVPEN
ncbi:spore gernimation protein GerT [Metabacillus sp. SLBN-84]